MDMRKWLLLVGILSVMMGPQRAWADEPIFGPPVLPAGFKITPAIEQLHHPTRITFGPDGRLYIAQQTGEVMAVTLKNGAEVSREQVATARLNPLGITLRGDKLWISDTGTIAVYTRTANGQYVNRQEIVTKIPNGRHQNDGFAWGPDGKLYWGLGSTTDSGPEPHPWSGSIMRMNADGTGVEVFARGFRNPYGIGFGPDGTLWVTDNGVDSKVSSDELNRVIQGGDYGFPSVSGAPPAGSKTRAPTALFGDHNSTDGLVVYTGEKFPEKYRQGIFVAMWGSSSDDRVGRAVGFVDVHNPDHGVVSLFATGFQRPLDVTEDASGDLWVADFMAGTIYRITYDQSVAPIEPVVPTVPPNEIPKSGPLPQPTKGPGPAPAPYWLWTGVGIGTLLTGGILWRWSRLRRR
jgi:glucose/arabinose dehydrogenase